MGTSFYGYGVYLSKSKETCNYYAEQMKDVYPRVWIYKVTVDGNLKSESEQVEFDGRSLGILELYNELVESGLSEKEASQKMVDDYGIDGITYWSQEDGNSLIVFNDAVIKIVDVEEML